MPYQIRKVRNKDCFMVRNIETGRVSAKCTTLEKAKRQVSLLMSIDDMPYQIRKRGDCYMVKNRETGKIIVSCVTREEAKRRLKLLMSIYNTNQSPRSPKVS